MAGGYKNQTMAVLTADANARKTGVRQFVFFNSKTGLYIIKLKEKKLKNESLVYVSR